MNNFFKVPNQLFIKKNKQIIKNKWKAIIEKTSSRKAIISSLNYFDKK